MPSKPELSSLLIPSFEISSKDFENTFLFNTPVRSHPFKVNRPARLYESSEDETSSMSTSPTTPRSSLEKVESPVWSQASSAQSSPRSQNVSPRATRPEYMEYYYPPVEPESVAKASKSPNSKPQPLLSRFNNSTSTSPTSIRDARRLTPVAENLNSTPVTPTRSTFANPPSSILAEQSTTTPPPLPRYFAIVNAGPPPPVPARSPRRSIASSPWTCLEGAHHPLCGGFCDVSIASTPANPPTTNATTTATALSTRRVTLPHISSYALSTSLLSTPVVPAQAAVNAREESGTGGMRRTMSWSQRSEVPVRRTSGRRRDSWIRAANAYGAAYGAGIGGADMRGGRKHGDVVMVK